MKDITILVEHIAGSHSYGMSIPTSDIDIRGLFCAQPKSILTEFYNVEEISDETQDKKFYELRKFVKLCVDANPNIIETLWVDSKFINFSTPYYEILRNHREDFLSSKVAYTYCGYAMSQIKRIKSHKKWINNPIAKESPKQTDYITLIYNFTNKKLFKINIYDYKNDYRLIPYDNNIFGLYQIDGYQTFDENYSLNTKYENNDYQFLDKNNKRIIPLFILKFNKNEYEQDKNNWINYWNWKNNRNVVRSELEELYGYDTKHAAHTIRLLRTGLEILKDEVVNVLRHDAQELIDIRKGKWSYEYLLKYTEEMHDEIMKKWYKETKLPKHSNIDKISKMLMNLQLKIWKDNNLI